MADKSFRFGVVATSDGGASKWRDKARRVEELGYTTLLVPDSLHFPTPTVSLAIAAAVTSTLRVGTYVLAIPMRTPRAAAWEAHSLTDLTDGRFELGLGTGLPAMRAAAAELGLPYGNATERLDQIAQTIDHLRRLEGGRRTSVLIAAGGPRATALAMEKADTVAISQFSGPREHALQAAQGLRDTFGGRLDNIELATNIFVVGDEVPSWIEQFVGADAETMIAQDSLTMLRGNSVAELAAEIQRRRDTLGLSYISVNQVFMEQFAPIVERLTGR